MWTQRQYNDITSTSVASFCAPASRPCDTVPIEFLPAALTMFWSFCPLSCSFGAPTAVLRKQASTRTKTQNTGCGVSLFTAEGITRYTGVCSKHRLPFLAVCMCVFVCLSWLHHREDGTLFERMNDFLDKWVRNDLSADFSTAS